MKAIRRNFFVLVLLGVLVMISGCGLIIAKSMPDTQFARMEYNEETYQINNLQIRKYYMLPVEKLRWFDPPFFFLIVGIPSIILPIPPTEVYDISFLLPDKTPKEARSLIGLWARVRQRRDDDKFKVWFNEVSESEAKEILRKIRTALKIDFSNESRITYQEVFGEDEK